MNHPATFLLPLAAGRVLDVLHAVLVVGELAIISHAEIAKRGKLSEGTVSRAMPVLVEHGFIERAWDDSLNSGRGGYLLTLLPLPNEESAEDLSVIGSATDPTVDDSNASERDQMLIPDAPNMVHDHESQSQEESRTRAPIDLDGDPLYRYLINVPDMHPNAAARIALSGFGTLTDFKCDLALAPRPGVTRPVFFVVAEWRAGRRIQPYLPPQEASYGRQDAAHRAERPAVAQKGAPRSDGNLRRRPSHIPAGFGRAPHEIGRRC